MSKLSQFGKRFLDATILKQLRSERILLSAKALSKTQALPTTTPLTIACAIAAVLLALPMENPPLVAVRSANVIISAQRNVQTPSMMVSRPMRLSVLTPRTRLI